MALNIGTLVAVLRLKADGFKTEANDAVASTQAITESMDALAKQADKTAAAVAGAAAAAAQATTAAARDAKGRFLPKGTAGAAGGAAGAGAGMFASLVEHSKRAVADIRGHFAKLKESAGDFAAVAAGAGLLAGALGMVVHKAVDAAAAYQETTGKIKAVFGESNLAVEEWATKTAHGLAMGQQQARVFASDIGAVIAPMIGSQKAAAGMSMRLTELGADLAAAFDSSNADAILAIRSAITGETEPMKRFGVVMNDANLAAFALSSGARTLYKDMTLAEKTQLRYNFILAQTSLIQGTAARELQGFSGQMRLAQGLVEDLAVTFGEPMRKALTPILQAFNDIATALSNVSPGVAELAAKLTLVVTVGAGVVAAVTGIAGALGGIGVIMPTIIAGFSTLFTTVLPIVVIMGVLVVVIGALYRAWKQSKDSIVDGASEIANKVMGALKWLASGVAKVFNAIVGLIVDVSLAPMKGLIKIVDIQLSLLQKLLVKLAGAARALGMNDIANGLDKALSFVSGGRQQIAFDMESITAAGENFKQLLDPNEIFKNVSDFYGEGGAGREALKGAGEAVIDAMKNGVGGFVDLLSDALGVDLNQKADPKEQGKDAALKPMGGKTPNNFRNLFGLEDAVTAAKPKIYTSFADAIRDALKDPEQWKTASWTWAYGAADALKSLLPAAGSGLAKELRDGIEGAASGVFDFLQTDTGKNMAVAGGDMLDSLLKGDFKIPDLGALGSAIGTAVAPGLGGVVGQAVGDSVGKVLQAIADKIADLIGQIRDGFMQMATIIGDILISNLGDKAQGTLSGLGQGAAMVGAIMSVVGASLALIGILAALSVAFLVLISPLISAGVLIGIFFGWLIAILGVGFALSAAILALITVILLAVNPFTYLAIAVGVVAAAFIALSAALVLAIGWFVALLQIGTMTKSFERFSLAIEWGARSVIDAVEPLFAALMPLAAIAVVVLQTFAQLSGVFLTMLENLGVFDFLFEAFRFAAVMVMQFSLGLLDGLEAMIKVFKNLAYTFGFTDLGDKLQVVDDAIDDWQSSLKSSIADLNAMTIESATARAIEAARMEELAQAMDAATAGSMNLPEAFKLNLARNGAIVPGLGDADGPGLPADKRVIVNVWINGEELEDIQEAQDRRDRFSSLIDTGIAGLRKKPRRRWNSPGPKN